MCLYWEGKKKRLCATVILTHEPLSYRRVCGTQPYTCMGAKKESNTLQFDGFSCVIAVV